MPGDPRSFSRRDILRASGSALFTGLLAGCVDEGNAAYDVALSGGGGGSTAPPNSGVTGGGWEEPPSRSETEAASDYGSIEDALNSVGPDTELVLDEDEYQEQITVPSTHSITLSGGEDGASITNPGVGSALIDGGGYSTESTSLSEVGEGASVLSVSDASLFEPGDDVQIQDPSDVYMAMTDSELNNTYNQYKGEFATVSSVDTSSGTVELEGGTHQDYPNPNGDLEVRRIDWSTTDIHIHGLTLDGGVGSPHWRAGSDRMAISISGARDVWVTDVTGINWNLDIVNLSTVLNAYVAGVHVDNIDRYGVSFVNGTTHGVAQNCTGEHITPEDSGYLIMAGGGATDNTEDPAPTYDIRGVGSTVQTADFLYEAHFGAENINYASGRVESGDAGAVKMRGVDQHLSGGEYDVSGWAVQSTQLAIDCSIEGATFRGGSHGWTLWPKEDQTFRNIRIVDCAFEDMSGDPVNFRETDGGQAPEIRGLEVVNSTWNGETIDAAMIEANSGFDSGRVEYEVR